MREAHNEPLQLDHPGLLREQSYIDGAWVDAPDGACFEVTNPADGAVVARVPEMGVDGARRAIEAAHAAWPEWRSKTAKERAIVLRRWFDLMVQHKDDLAAIMTAEQGKPLAESAGEVMYGEVPPYSVVVAGSMPSKNGINLYCAVIVKRVDEKTRSKTSINELLRD